MLNKFLRRKAEPTLTLRAFTNSGNKQIAHYTNLSQVQVNKIITLLSEYDDSTNVLINVTKE